MEADLHFDEKLHWLRALERAGVRETVVWGVDDDAGALVEAARDLGIGVEISLFGKVYFPNEMRDLLDRAAAVGASQAAFVGRGADFSLEEMGWSRQQMLDACVLAAQEARERGVPTSIGLAYSTQSDPEYVCEVARAVEDAGCDVFHIPDSLGVASPEQMGALVARVRAAISIPIEVHCHNDYGLATANAIASVQAGADLVEVIVNAQDPERSGIASLDEVAVSLELLYGYETGIDLSQLTLLSRLHEQITGARIADSKPIVGRRAFNYRVAPGDVTSAPKRDHFYGSPRVVPFNPTIVGNERLFLLGKYSGPNEVTKRLTELGVSIDTGFVPEVVRLVNDRGRSTKRSVSDDELRYFVETVSSAHTQVAAT